MNTDLLQVLLVAKLPDKLAQMRGAIRWIEGEQRRVLDTEWDYIVRLVEEESELTVAYLNRLSVLANKNNYDTAFAPLVLGCITASWQQRATAMKECGII